MAIVLLMPAVFSNHVEYINIYICLNAAPHHPQKQGGFPLYDLLKRGYQLTLVFTSHDATVQEEAQLLL